MNTSVESKRFNCPHCGAFADQEWYNVAVERIWHKNANVPPANLYGPEHKLSYNAGIFFVAEYGQSHGHLHNTYASKCASCQNVALWIGDRQVHPPATTAPKINQDTPNNIAEDYLEAASIMSISPRGAAALLRLAIQKLCAHLGESGKNINNDISELVKKGLDKRIQQALDVLRVIGNEAVHPGTMDLRDDQSTVESLFLLFNIIVERMISEPKHIDSVYNTLPSDKILGIVKRDEEKGTD